MTYEDACHFMWREEITDWGTYDYVPNHTYVTKGTDLIGYVPRNTGSLQVFTAPLKSWGVSRRKFRKLNRKEIKAHIDMLNSSK